MAAKKTTEAVVMEEVHNADTAKAKLFELIEAKAKDMLKGPDRVNDPKTIEAIATLYNAIK
jgi:hypothetical protein